MKTKQAPIKLPSFLLAHKKLTITGAVVFIILTTGATVYAYHLRSQNSPASATTSTSSKLTDSKSTIALETETPTTPTSESSPPQTSSTPQTTSTTSPTQQKIERQRPSPITGPTTVSATATFSVGRINSAYTYCVNGALHYMLGGVDIYSSVPTTQSFTWRLEVSDGTISDSGTSTMPDNKSYWTSFPSTPSYPSMIGSIENANDGDRARVVITSPNYAAGGWSDPVPTGSEASCQNG